MNTSRKHQPWAIVLAMATLFIIAAGCAEKISGPGQSNSVSVNMGLKAGPAVSFRLTVSAADMDTVKALMGPSDTELVTVVEVPLGDNRLFVVEALAIDGAVLYRGEELHNVTALVPLDLTIDMPPVAPMMYLSPHYSTVTAGNSFVLTVSVNELAGLSGAGFGVSLANNDNLPKKLMNAAVIDTVILHASQLAIGTSLSVSRDSATDVFISLFNQGPLLVDSLGDARLVEIHCISQDLWQDEPIDVVPSMFFENLNGIDLDIDDVHLDTARIRVAQDGGPASYLGTEEFEAGVAMVPLNGGDSMLAGLTLTGDPGGRVFEYFLSVTRLNQNLQPTVEKMLPWSGDHTTAGLASSSGNFFGLGNNAQVGGEVIYFDSVGGEIFRTTLGGDRQMHDIASRPGGGSIIAGSYSNDGNHFYLAALDDNGSFISYEGSNFSADEEFRAVVAFTDGTYGAAGTARDFSGNSQNIVVGKYTLTDQLKPLWEREFVTNSDRIVNDVLATPDGGLLVVGGTSPVVGGPYDVLVVKFDQDGAFEWENTFAAAGNEFGMAAVMGSNGSYVITGQTTATGQSTRDVVVIRISASGGLIWQRVMGGPEDDLALDIVLRGSGYLVTGLTNPGPFGSGDIMLLSLDSEGR